MDEFLSATASRRLWSKSLQRKKVDGLSQRREPAVTLPALGRSPSGQHTDSRKTSLHAFLASQLEGNDRESYSRSQLRAMASFKLQPSSNNNFASTSSRIHSSAERLAPLDPASFEKTSAFQQRRPLPRPLQAAIDEVLAVRNNDELPSDREDRRGDNNNDSDGPLMIPSVRRSSPCKKQLHDRRPEWRRYIRRIMMTKGIRGSTLARYRRLVGMIARKNLAQSFAGAAERVVRYRLDFRSATKIQRMVLHFLTRRRQAKEQRRHRAAARIQHAWRKALEGERQRKLAEEARQATIDRSTRLGAARVIQRLYRNHRCACRLRENELRQQQHASMLQRARCKLLQRYQSWRQSSTRDKIDDKAEQASGITSSDVLKNSSCKAFINDETHAWSPEGFGHVQVVGTSMVSDELGSTKPRRPSANAPHEIDCLEDAPIPISVSLNENEPRVDENESTCFEELAALPLDQPIQNIRDEDVFAAASTVENQLDIQDNAPAEPPIQDNQEASLPCRELCEWPSEDSNPSCATKTEPEEDNDSNANNAGADEENAPVQLSYPPEELQQALADAAEDTSDTDSAAVAVVAASITRRTAARKISRYLLPKLQAGHTMKTHAAIQIQCLARSHLSRQCMIRVRLEALHSLREQLHASWNRLAFEDQASSSDNMKEHDVEDPDGDQNDDEDDDFSLEAQEYQSSLHSASDNYAHLLPTRNGQIPPGVAPLQSSAGAPLLSLWKWSWPDEKWLSTGQ